jgi:hypothetical protein
MSPGDISNFKIHREEISTEKPMMITGNIPGGRNNEFPFTPVENIAALYEAGEKFGRINSK